MSYDIQLDRRATDQFFAYLQKNLDADHYDPDCRCIECFAMRADFDQHWELMNARSLGDPPPSPLPLPGESDGYKPSSRLPEMIFLVATTSVIVALIGWALLFLVN